MHYGARRSRDSIPPAVPLLLAGGALALLAIAWRRLAAPRMESDARRTTRHATELETPDAHSGDVQPVGDGTGEVFHRQYDVLLTGIGTGSQDVMRLMQRNIAELAPAMLARFEKTSGADGLLRVGDEYDITMLGPWNGMVRVSESSTDAFTLVTLDGHPEAGHITFRTRDEHAAAGAVRVEIESWAQARDSIVAAAYDKIGLGKQVQTEVWITFLQRLAGLAGMRDRPEVRISTERVPIPESDTDAASRG